MPITQEKAVKANQILLQANVTMREIQRCLQLSNLTYQIAGKTETLPETHKKALLQEYETLKVKLKVQIESLP